MDITNLFGDERAASPVVGIVLTAAITVVVAALIGSFVFGLGSTAREGPPDASFSFTYEPTDSNFTVTATHADGETIPEEETVTLSGPNNSVAFEGPVTPESSESLTSVPPDSEVRVVWTSEDGETSHVLAEDSTPS